MSDLEKALEQDLAFADDEVIATVVDAARRFANLTSPESPDTEVRLWMCRLRLTDGSTRRTIRDEKPTVCWYTGVSEHIHHCGWFVPVEEAVLRSVEEGET